MEDFYTAQEVADILKIKKTTVYELIKKKKFPAAKVGKQIRINKEDFDAYMEHQTESPVPKQTDSPAEKTKSGQDDAVIADRQDGGSTTEAVPDGNFIEQAIIKDTSETVYRSRDFLRNNTGLILSGEDELITAFYQYYRLEEEAIPVVKQWKNSYDSLYSLYLGNVHAAFVTVPDDREEQIYNIMLPGMNIVSVHVADVEYGLYINRKWEKRVRNIDDLLTTGCRFIAAEKGSLSRILFDRSIKEQGMNRKAFYMAEKESLSTLQALLMIKRGKADAAIGSSRLKEQFPELLFIPLQKCSLKLIFNKKYYSFPAFPAMVNVLASENFRRRLLSMGGYGPEKSGDIKIF